MIESAQYLAFLRTSQTRSRKDFLELAEISSSEGKIERIVLPAWEALLFGRRGLNSIP
jgi:hypothetical protein